MSDPLLTKPTAAPNLAQVIRPEARDRFARLLLRGMTPERVQSILDGAFAGMLPMQHELFDLMEDTWPRLKKNLNEVKRAVITSDWHSEPACRPESKPTPQAQAKADFLNEALHAFAPAPETDENGFTDMVYDLLDAFGKGVSVQEILWEARANIGRSGAGIIARATRWVPADYYGYYGSDPALRLFPQGVGREWIAFPANKFIVAFFKTKTGHPVSGALLRSLASWWISASFAQDWALNLAQLFGLPIRTAEYDPQLGPKLRNDICHMLENMGSAAWGAFPIGTKLELHETSKNAGSSPQAFIMGAADTAADILILGQTLTSSEGASGSRALGEVHLDVRQDVLQYVARWAQARLDQSFVGPMMRLNFGDNIEDPHLICEITKAKDAKAMAERDEILIAKLGMKVPRRWLYHRHDVPVPDEGEEVFEATSDSPANAPSHKSKEARP
jgi:phage gp29-like protein